MKLLWRLFIMWALCLSLCSLVLSHSRYRPTPPTGIRNSPTHEDFSECGKSERRETHIVGRKNASLGDWPWMVALNYRSPKNETHFKCGATLISKQWVVTAAHCAQIGNYTLLSARFGDLDLNDSVSDGASPIDIPIDQTILHPQFSTKPVINDIALIHLSSPVQFTEFIRPVCLPSNPTFKANDFYRRKQPYMIGWGATDWSWNPTKLQEGSIRIVDKPKCAQQYATIRDSLINDNVICAGELERGDPCQGDSGGTIMFPMFPNFTEIRYYLGGIVSYGVRCVNNYFGVYTRVAQYIDWINQVTGEKF